MTQVPSGKAPDLSAQSARQARWGSPVFVVLIISTVLAAMALLAAWAWRSGDLARVQPRPGPAAAGQFNTPDTNRGAVHPGTPTTAPTQPRE